jgi:hypothetical protein
VGVATKKRLDELFLEYMREEKPQQGRALLERTRNEDRLVLWLTAISAGAIAVTVSNAADLAAFRSQGAIVAAVICFAFTIFFGVSARVIILFGDSWLDRLMRDFKTYLYVESVYKPPPKDLPDFFNAEQIAHEMKNEFGLDYMALLEDNPNVGFWREQYEKARSAWMRDTKEGLGEARRKERALQGLTNWADFQVDPNREVSGLRVPEEGMVRMAKRLARLTKLSTVLFWVAVSSFLVGVCITSWCLVRYFSEIRCL